MEIEQRAALEIKMNRTIHVYTFVASPQDDHFVQ